MQFEARKLLGRRGGLPPVEAAPPAALPRGLLTRLRDSDPHAKGTANRAGRPYETLVAWAPGGLKLERAFSRKMSAATVVPPSMIRRGMGHPACALVRPAAHCAVSVGRGERAAIPARATEAVTAAKTVLRFRLIGLISVARPCRPVQET